MFTWEREETGRPLDTGVGEVGERPAWSVEGMISRSRGNIRRIKISRITSWRRDLVIRVSGGKLGVHC